MNGIQWQQRSGSGLFETAKSVNGESPQKMETDEKKSSSPSQSPMHTPNPTQPFPLQGTSQREAYQWIRRGNALRDKMEIGKAIDCYRKAVALNSCYLDPLQKIEGGYKLAATLLHRRGEGDLHESLQLFQEITQASKYLEAAHPKLLQKILGCYVFALLQRGAQGDVELVKKWAEKGVVLKPRDPNACARLLLALGNWHLENKGDDYNGYKALELYEKGLSLPAVDAANIQALQMQRKVVLNAFVPLYVTKLNQLYAIHPRTQQVTSDIAYHLKYLIPLLQKRKAQGDEALIDKCSKLLADLQPTQK